MWSSKATPDRDSLRNPSPSAQPSRLLSRLISSQIIFITSPADWIATSCRRHHPSDTRNDFWRNVKLIDRESTFDVARNLSLAETSDRRACHAPFTIERAKGYTDDERLSEGDGSFSETLDRFPVQLH